MDFPPTWPPLPLPPPPPPVAPGQIQEAPTVEVEYNAGGILTLGLLGSAALSFALGLMVALVRWCCGLQQKRKHSAAINAHAGESGHGDSHPLVSRLELKSDDSQFVVPPMAAVPRLVVPLQPSPSDGGLMAPRDVPLGSSCGSNPGTRGAEGDFARHPVAEPQNVQRALPWSSPALPSAIEGAVQEAEALIHAMAPAHAVAHPASPPSSIPPVPVIPPLDTTAIERADLEPPHEDGGAERPPHIPGPTQEEGEDGGARDDAIALNADGSRSTAEAAFVAEAPASPSAGGDVDHAHGSYAAQVLTMDLEELEGEAPDERQRRLDWIRYYVRKGELQRAFELGWNGKLRRADGVVSGSGAEEATEEVILGQFNWGKYYSWGTSSHRSEPGSPPEAPHPSRVIFSPSQLTDERQPASAQVGGIPGGDAFIAAARMQLRPTGRALTPRPTKTPRVIATSGALAAGETPPRPMMIPPASHSPRATPVSATMSATLQAELSSTPCLQGLGLTSVANVVSTEDKAAAGACSTVGPSPSATPPLRHAPMTELRSAKQSPEQQMQQHSEQGSDIPSTSGPAQLSSSTEQAFQRALVTPLRPAASAATPSTSPAAAPVPAPAQPVPALEHAHAQPPSGAPSMSSIATSEQPTSQPAVAEPVAPQAPTVRPDAPPPEAPPLLFALALGGSMPDGAHVDKLGTYLPQPDDPDVNGWPCYVKNGQPGILCWHASGRWWVGKRSELGQPRGFLKAPGSDRLPPQKGWLVISTKTKPPGWKEAADLSCEPAVSRTAQAVSQMMDPVKRATKHQTKLAQIFSEFDADGSRALTRDEITSALKAKTSLAQSEIDEFFSVCDRNQDGSLTMMEAMRGFKALQKEGKLSELA